MRATGQDIVIIIATDILNILWIGYFKLYRCFVFI